MDLQLGLFPDDRPTPSGSAVGPATPTPAITTIARELPPSLRMGTSSWSFPGWEGVVYDRRATESTLARNGLVAYAKHPLLRTVGIDRTFYRPIDAGDFRRYADVVPRDFRFLVKADRVLTSPLDPESFGVRQRNPRFLDAAYAASEVVGPFVEGLGSKAGPLLFQFPPIPPNLVGGGARFLDRLQRFLEGLPSGPTYAIELRTPAFFSERYATMLEDVGATHCYNVHPASVPFDRQLRLLSPFYQPVLVVRWMLHAGLRYEVAKDRYEPFDRIVDEDTASRERIAVAVLDALVAERSAFVIANNKAEGSAPLSIFRLAETIARWAPRAGTPVGAGDADSPGRVGDDHAAER